jgi:hypothetical protein
VSRDGGRRGSFLGGGCRLVGFRRRLFGEVVVVVGMGEEGLSWKDLRRVEGGKRMR